MRYVVFNMWRIVYGIYSIRLLIHIRILHTHTMVSGIPLVFGLGAVLSSPSHTPGCFQGKGFDVPFGVEIRQL